MSKFPPQSIFKVAIYSSCRIISTTEYYSSLAFNSSRSGAKAFSIPSFFLTIEYLIFYLFGECDKMNGFTMPSFLQMSLRDVFVAVAVRAIRCTPSGKRLRISPSLENSLRNVSPLCEVQIEQVFKCILQQCPTYL